MALICIFIAGCSQHDFTPIWRLCGVTITDSKDNTAVLYEGCEPSVFDIDLDTGESYSLDILRTDDNTSAAGFDISFICNGEELLSSQASMGFYVSKDGDTYTFNHIPSTEQSVDVIVSRDGAVVGILSINIRKDEAPEPPEAPVTITLSFDTTTENPELITIEAEEEISNLEIYYTLDGTDPTRASEKYEGSIDLSDAEGDEILRAKGFSGQSESDVIELDYLIKARTYIVYSEEGLSIWAMQGGNCILGKDIALVSNWTPVELYGKFDGRDHLIANLVIDYPDVDDVGFISCCYGSVHDLHLSDVSIVGGNNVGGIAGDLYGGEVNGCSVSGSIKGTNNHAGGIAGGVNGASIIDCRNEGTIVSRKYAGGIAGQIISGSKVEGCKNNGDVSASSMAGGIAGFLEGSEVISSSNYGSISGSDKIGGIAGSSGSSPDNIVSCTNHGSVSGMSEIGGIIGYANATDIDSCSNYGTVSGEAAGQYIGGIAGYAAGVTSGDILIVSCRNEGSVSSPSSSFVGGIAGGIASPYIFVEASSNANDVSGNANVGGIAGAFTDVSRTERGIIASYNAGAISGSSYVGGIIGRAEETRSRKHEFISCYNTGSITGTSYVGGIGTCVHSWPNDPLPKFSGCYWQSGSAPSAGGNATATEVTEWDDSILEGLNGAIAEWDGAFAYEYVKNNGSSNEPFVIREGV